jgi:hypothetical protein
VRDLLKQNDDSKTTDTIDIAERHLKKKLETKKALECAVTWDGLNQQ